MDSPRDIRGAAGGSRLFEQPAYKAEKAAYHAVLSCGRPCLLEIGFDHGRRLLDSAIRNPEWQHVGMEVRKARVAELERRREHHGLDNLLPWRVDARTALANLTPAGTVDVVEVLFPTPWWHRGLRAKRLLITPEFVADAAAALKSGGALLISTDVEGYADQIRAALQTCDALLASASAAQRRPAVTAWSRRMWKCEREGLPVYNFTLVRR